MDCKHERQARLDQWIEDLKGVACAFCLQAEVERLKAENEELKFGLDAVQGLDGQKIDDLGKKNNKLREALKGARDMIERHGGDADFIKEALKDLS